MDVYGSPESINAVTRNDLSAFYRSYFTGRNLVISVVSGMKPEESIALVEKTFSGLDEGSSFKMSPVPITVQPELLEIPLGKPQAALAVGSVTGELEGRDLPAMAVASALLNTRLVEQVREKEGLAYSIGASIGAVGDRAVFTLSMGTGPDNVEKARKSIREQVEAVRSSSVSREAMQREINGLTGRLQMRMLSSINRAYYLGIAAMQGLSHTFGDDYKELLEALTPEEVQDALRKYLPEENLVEVVVR
jgi:zinc protease